MVLSIRFPRGFALCLPHSHSLIIPSQLFSKATLKTDSQSTTIARNSFPECYIEEAPDTTNRFRSTSPLRQGSDAARERKRKGTDNYDRNRYEEGVCANGQLREAALRKAVDIDGQSLQKRPLCADGVQNVPHGRRHAVDLVNDVVCLVRREGADALPVYMLSAMALKE